VLKKREVERKKRKHLSKKKGKSKKGMAGRTAEATGTAQKIAKETRR